MHSLRFPKILKIQLPELQREALQQISRREPNQSPAELLEAILAAGLRSKLLSYPEAVEDTTSGVEGMVHGSADIAPETSPPIHLQLNSERSERVFRILKGRSCRTPEELALWMLEWGLDAFEESMLLTYSSDDGNGVGAR